MVQLSIERRGFDLKIGGNYSGSGKFFSVVTHKLKKTLPGGRVCTCWKDPGFVWIWLTENQFVEISWRLFSGGR